jgi:hypothetical protein
MVEWFSGTDFSRWSIVGARPRPIVTVQRTYWLRKLSLARALAMIPRELRVSQELSPKFLAEKICRENNFESSYCKDSLRGILVVATKNCKSASLDEMITTGTIRALRLRTLRLTSF